MKKADMVLRLKKWAKVMMVTNDILGKWINGSMGTVQNLWEDYVDVEIGGEVFMIGSESRANKEIIVSRRGKITENILGSYEQFPLKLAYAITVHKSQGMTFDACNLDLCNTFTWGQAYTALSRSKTLSGITLINKIEKRHLFFDSAIKFFTQNTLQSTPIQENDITDYVKQFK
jgi:ATP-dependent exoDNAse (exonuclease V) alpha subunit